MNLDKFMQLSEDLMRASEAHLEAFKAFIEYKEKCIKTEDRFNQMMQGKEDEYTKLQEFEDRFDYIMSKLTSLY